MHSMPFLEHFTSPSLYLRRMGSALVLLMFAALGAAGAADLPDGFSESRIPGSLSSPTAMSFAPDGRLFVCEQGGRLRVIKNGAVLATPFVTISVDSSGERGLLGVAIDPDFASNRFVYVYYTTSSSPIHNRLARFTASATRTWPIRATPQEACHSSTSPI